MRSGEEHPVVLRCDGSRARPARVLLMANRAWRVDWLGGLVSIYHADPRGHLALGYEPEHVRWWKPPPARSESAASSPSVALGDWRP